jgi:hypothetical protein
MRIWIRTASVVACGALAASLTLSIPDAAQAQAPAAAKGKGGKGFAQDPRAQTRMYHFEDTNEDLPYSLYVSSKVKKDQKAPLVVTLHGLGAPQTIMMGKTAVDLAEEAGCILVAPMGYNTGGWYGSPVGTGPGRGKGKGAPPAAPGTPNAPPIAAPNVATPAPDAVAKGPGGASQGKAGFGGFGGGNQPANLRELSEKDTMNVIAMVRKEFKIETSESTSWVIRWAALERCTWVPNTPTCLRRSPRKLRRRSGKPAGRHCSR